MTYQFAKEPMSKRTKATVLTVVGFLVIIVIAFIFIVPFLIPAKSGVIEDYTEYKKDATISGFQRGNTIQWKVFGLVAQSPPAKTAATFKASAFQDSVVGNFTDKSIVSNLESIFITMLDSTHVRSTTKPGSWFSINVWISSLGAGADTQFALYFGSYTTTKIYNIALITFPTWELNAKINYKNSAGVVTTANGPIWYPNRWMNIKCIIDPPSKFYMKFDGVTYKLSSTSNFTAIDNTNMITHGLNTIHCNFNLGSAPATGSVYLGYIFASWAL